MSEARAAILNRIREQLGKTVNLDSTLTAYRFIPRHYTQAGILTPQARTHLLLERLADYDAEIWQIHEGEIAAKVQEVLLRDRESILLVPAAIPEPWLPTGFAILRDTPATPQPLAALSSAHAVLTSCAGAIAETGTLLLEHGAGPGRRALTLLPDHHICVLRTDQIVETVCEGFALLAGSKQAALTTVSGPSATADIEMTRIRGVHGPRRLTVLLLT